MYGEDDYVDPDEIARLFQSELQRLSEEDDAGLEEEDAELRLLDNLGKELRYSLHMSDEVALGDGDGDGDAWAALLESSKHTTDRLQDWELASSQSPEVKQHRSALEDLRLQEAAINMNLNNLTNIVTSPRRDVQEEVEMGSTIRDLMDSMLASVEFTWKIVISKEREVANTIVIDYSKLPKIIADDVEVEGQEQDLEALKAEMSGYELRYASKADQLEKERIRDSFNMLKEDEAEAILLQEAEETARLLEEDRQQRIQRKLRMMEEIMRAKQAKAATRIQTRQRGALARARVKKVRLDMQLETELAAERLRVQIELQEEKERVQKEMERRKREFVLEKREQEEMRDEDLLSMQARNWENLCKEREAQRLFVEREAERLFAEERYKNGRILEKIDESRQMQNVPTLSALPSTAVDPTPPSADGGIAVASPIGATDEDDSAFATELMEAPWTRFGDEDEEKLLKAQTPRPADAANTRTAPAPPKAAKKTQQPKTKKPAPVPKKAPKKNKGSDSDEDDDDEEDDEDGGEESGDPDDEGEESDGEDEDEDEDESEEDVNSEDEDEDSETRAQPLADAIALPTAPQPVPLSPLPRLMGDLPQSVSAAALRANFDKGAECAETIQHWRDLADQAVAAGLREMTFEPAAADRAARSLQKKSNFPLIDAPQEPLGEKTAVSSASDANFIVSPRAKLGGMRLVASRTAPHGGTESDEKSLRKEIEKENFMIRDRESLFDIGRKVLYKYIFSDERPEKPVWRRSSRKQGTNNAGIYPLIGALDTWKRFCEEELLLVSASLAPRSMPRQYQDTHGFDSPMHKKEPAANERSDDEKIKQLGIKRDPAQVKSLQLNVEGLHSCSFLRNYTRIRHLELNVNRLCSLDGLRFMSNLEELSVKDNALTDIGALRFTTSLQTLSLDTNRIADLSDLGRLPYLSTLCANTNNLTEMPILSGCDRLQRLELYQNHIADVSIDALKMLTCLTHLDLGRNKLEHIDGTALSNCILLQTLVLSQNKLSEVPAPLYLPLLKTLWLSGNKLQNLDYWLPTRSTYPDVAVERQDAWGFINDANNDYENPSAGGQQKQGSAFHWSTFVPLLERLYMQDNAIEHVNAASMLCFPSLSFIDLSFNNIANVSSLGVTVCPKLHTLEVQENPVSNSTAGTDPLFKWLMTACPGLKVISGNGVGDSDKLATMHSAAVETAERDRLLSTFLQVGEWRDYACAEMTRTNCHKTSVNSASILANLGAAHISSEDPDTATPQTRLAHFISLVQTEQAVFDTNHKLDKKVAATGGTSSTADQGAWDFAYIEMLKRHAKSLLDWSEQADKGTNSNFFVSFRNLNSEPRQAVLSGRYEGKNSFQVRNLACMAIQALVRGRNTRRTIRKALASVEYKDAEIDELDAMLEDLETNMDLEFADASPESVRGFVTTTTTGSTRSSVGASKVLSSASESSPMVYGDHSRRSKRSGASSAVAPEENDVDFVLAPSRKGPNSPEEEIPAQLSNWMSSNVAQIRQALTGGGGGGAAAAPSDTSSFQPIAHLSPRPSSAMSDSSTITEGSLPSSAPRADGAFEPSGGAGGRVRASGLGSGPQRTGSGSSTLQAQMASEWGISDPKVMAMMMKRNNRLQGLPASAGLDSQGGSVSGTSKRKPVTVVSGSFGGSKKTTKSTKKGQKMPPAWALGPSGGED